MNQKLRVGLLCGGRSCEHEISLLSAQNVLAALDPEKYEVTTFVIDKQGQWHQIDSNILLNKESQQLLTEGIVPACSENRTETALVLPRARFDVLFPILHGPYGEDGTVQGLLKMTQIPFVGPSVLAAAVAMDKEIMKRLLRDAGLPIARFCTLTSHQKANIDYSAIIADLGLPLFVKPANLGSSVGVSKAKDEAELISAIAYAFRYDRKVIVEEFVEGREIECAVLGNEEPIASTVGEIRTAYEFYSYEAKYFDQQLQLDIPAKISCEEMQRTQLLAIKAFLALNCEGMARVDCFLKQNGEILINEVNTIPGFTNVSMYPKLWEASGISYRQLIERLIQLAIERHHAESELVSAK